MRSGFSCGESRFFLIVVALQLFLYGLVGDRVFVLTQGHPEVDYEKDSQGYGWYRVGFPRSGAQGWIREDFLQVKCDFIND